MKIDVRAVLLLFVLLFSGLVFAQRDMNLVSARKLVEKGLYYEAKEKYEAALKLDSTKSDVNVEYADVLFFHLADYEKAYWPIVKSITKGRDTSMTHFYCLAKCEQFLEMYDLAELHYNKMLEMAGKKKKHKELRTEVEINLKSIAFAKKNGSGSNLARIKIVNAGTNVNTQYEEYVPVVDEKENFLLFTSRRKNQYNKIPNEEEERYPEDMYVSVRNGNNFSAAELMPAAFTSIQDIKNSKKNESLVSLSPDGSTLFLYKEGTLWKSDFSNGKWSLPTLLDKNIIADDYDNHVSITGDGKTVYFTSERKTGYGGTDIFCCIKNDDGTWSAAANLGKKFNTAGNEQSPFISKDGKTLYFSSDKRDGFGGYDVYVSVFNGKEWSEPQNMGLPVNSAADDVFFYPNENCSEGYLSSNRKGTIGGFDIFRFYYMDKPSFKRSGNQMRKDQMKQISSEEFLTELAAQNTNAEKVFYRVNDTLIVEDPNDLTNILEQGEDLKVEVQLVYACDTCFYRNEKFLAYNVIKQNLKEIDPGEKEKHFEKVEIYFASNSAGLESENTGDLDRLSDWLKENTHKRVVVYGYSDDRGAWQHNKLLSIKRANSVYKYLLTKGVAAAQIIAVEGKGEIEDSGLADKSKNRKVVIELAPEKLTSAD